MRRLEHSFVQDLLFCVILFFLDQSLVMTGMLKIIIIPNAPVCGCLGLFLLGLALVCEHAWFHELYKFVQQKVRIVRRNKFKKLFYIVGSDKKNKKTFRR